MQKDQKKIIFTRSRVCGCLSRATTTTPLQPSIPSWTLILETFATPRKPLGSHCTWRLSIINRFHLSCTRYSGNWLDSLHSWPCLGPRSPVPDTRDYAPIPFLLRLLFLLWKYQIEYDKWLLAVSYRPLSSGSLLRRALSSPGHLFISSPVCPPFPTSHSFFSFPLHPISLSLFLFSLPFPCL